MNDILIVIYFNFIPIAIMAFGSWIYWNFTNTKEKGNDDERSY